MFGLDTHLEEGVKGFLLMVDDVPAGLAAIASKGQSQHEMCEFYIVPSYRHNHLGRDFAHGLWRLLPGEWEVKQIAGAEYATTFWRRTISEFDTMNGYAEDQYQDPYWGVVMRQRFGCAGTDRVRRRLGAPVYKRRRPTSRSRGTASS